MRLVHAPEVEPQEVMEEGAAKVTVRWLLSRPEGAPSFAMRLFEVAPGGQTPQHEHTWEHEVFVLEGRVEVIGNDAAAELTPGDAVLVLPSETHQFRNRGEHTARFLCMIPLPE
jgi:quercetin dioxygenase-like cupin family protein